MPESIGHSKSYIIFRFFNKLSSFRSFFKSFFPSLISQALDLGTEAAVVLLDLEDVSVVWLVVVSAVAVALG